MEEVTKGDALAAVAEAAGSKGVKLLSDMMEIGVREREWITKDALTGAEKDRDRWKKRALEAEARLDMARHRLLDLFE